MKGSLWTAIGFWGGIIILLLIIGTLIVFWGNIGPVIAKAMSNLPTGLQNA